MCLFSYVPMCKRHNVTVATSLPLLLLSSPFSICLSRPHSVPILRLSALSISFRVNPSRFLNLMGIVLLHNTFSHPLFAIFKNFIALLSNHLKRLIQPIIALFISFPFVLCYFPFHFSFYSRSYPLFRPRPCPFVPFPCPLFHILLLSVCIICSIKYFIG